MYQKIKKIVFFILACLHVSFSIAQTPVKNNAVSSYRAIPWTIYDGLAFGGNTCMLKDMDGFVWIGTATGLSRFDGNTFKNYFANKKEGRNAIIEDHIVGLIEDSLHNIWIGTQNGLSRYDLRADTFTNFQVVVGPPHDDHVIIPFWVTKDLVYCVSNMNTILSFNIHSFERKIFPILNPVEALGGWLFSFQYAFFDQETNSVWVLPQNKIGISQVSLSTGKVEFYGWASQAKKLAGGHNIALSMHYDHKRNCIWINSCDGLLQFGLKDKQFHFVEALAPFEKIKNYDHVGGIDLDPKGRIWLATFQKGILIYDPNDQSVKFPFPDDSLSQKEVSDGNSVIYCDPVGVVWTSTGSPQKGFYQLVPYSPAVTHYVADHRNPHGLNSDDVYTFANADQDHVWIPTDGGINIFDLNTGQFSLLNVKGLQGLATNQKNPKIDAIYIDILSKKALLQADVLFEMDLETRNCRPIIFKGENGLKINVEGNSRINWPAPSFRNGFICTANYGDKTGIFAIKGDSAVARELVSLFPANNNFNYMTVADDRLVFIQRQAGRSSRETYSFINSKLVLTPNPLDSIAWDEIIYKKADQTYWVKAERQLIQYNNDFHVIRRYTQKDGLPLIDFSALTLDNKGNIWFHTDRSIHQLSTETGSVSALTEKDGFEKQNFFVWPSSLKDARGDIYFPSGVFGRGFNKISPDKYIAYLPSSVYIRSLEINQKPFPTPTGPNWIQELSLKYSQNKISLETGIVDYFSKGSSRIRYKLEPQNKEWQYAPYYYTIRYEDLSPGNYQLVMQASNAGNEFNGPEKILIIHITPPFWETWWFRILAAIFIAALIYSFIQYRSRNLRKRNIVLEEKVLVRTKELKHSLEDLRETQTQLIQSEKMASLGELTAGIAHEIQNPLNFVNNFSELNSELIDEMNTELDKGDINEAKFIASDIKQNLEKINHHGKRADAIVKGMLQHSQSSTGRKEPTDVNKLADEYLRLSYHGIRSKDKNFNVTLKTDFDESIRTINIITQDIGRVLLNLYNNAFYACTERSRSAVNDALLSSAPDYQPTVSISTKKLNNKVEIKVKDNGNGIPQKVVDKIFQPFFTTKPTGLGTGLGLSLSYDIIKAHGGEIKVETKEGEGSEFIVILPVSPEAL